MRIRNSSFLNIVLAAFLLPCLDCRDSEELRPSASKPEQPSTQDGNSSDLSLIAFDTGILRVTSASGTGGNRGGVIFRVWGNASLRR